MIEWSDGDCVKWLCCWWLSKVGQSVFLTLQDHCGLSQASPHLSVGVVDTIAFPSQRILGGRIVEQ